MLHNTSKFMNTMKMLRNSLKFMNVFAYTDSLKLKELNIKFVNKYPYELYDTNNSRGMFAFIANSKSITIDLTKQPSKYFKKPLFIGDYKTPYIFIKHMHGIEPDLNVFIIDDHKIKDYEGLKKQDLGLHPGHQFATFGVYEHIYLTDSLNKSNIHHESDYDDKILHRDVTTYSKSYHVSLNLDPNLSYNKGDYLLDKKIEIIKRLQPISMNIHAQTFDDSDMKSLEKIIDAYYS